MMSSFGQKKVIPVRRFVHSKKHLNGFFLPIQNIDFETYY